MSKSKAKWASAPLAVACRLVTDGTHHSPPSNSSGDFAYVTARHVKKGGLDLSNLTYVDRNTHMEIYKRAPVKKGDVLYIKDGATTGIAAVNERDEQFSLLSSVALLSPDGCLLDSHFLSCWLNSPVAYADLTGQMGGSAIRRLTLRKISAHKVPLPPIAEQRRIVAKIDRVSARSERARSELEIALRLVNAAKAATLSQLHAGSLGTIELGRCLEDIRYGTSAKCHLRPSGIEVLRIPNVSSGKISLEDLKYAELPENEISKLTLAEGDVLIIRSNGSPDLVGKAALVGGAAIGMAFAGYLIRLRLDRTTLLPEFLHFVLRSPQLRHRIMQAAKSTSGVHNINSKELQALNIPRYTVEDQHEIVHRIEHAFAAIDRLAAEARSASALLDKLDQAILAKAFRGELVPQDPNDESASVLLQRCAERAAAGRKSRGRRLPSAAC